MNSWTYLLQLIVLLALIRMGYETSVTTRVSVSSLPIPESAISPKLKEMFPPERMERIKKQELRRYKLAQKKKWDNWLESVSK
jgi:hypothetical protein